MAFIKLRKLRALTLIELVVAISIIAVLATFSVLSLYNARVKGRDARRLSDIKQIQNALSMFFNVSGRYPNSEEFNSGSISYHSPLSGTTTYLETIPSAPMPPDGDCTVTDNTYTYTPRSNNSLYTLDFCIAKGSGVLSAGKLTAWPSGISPYVCQGTCEGKVCGDDGCGGSCGTCTSPSVCSNNQCVCQTDCTGKVCGDDGCGGSCGTCGPTQTCDSGICQNVEIFRLAEYGDTSIDYVYGVCTDDTYLYWVGKTRQPGYNDYDSMIVKSDKNFNVLDYYIFNTLSSNDNFSRCVVADGRLLTNGSSIGDFIMASFNTDDLSYNTHNTYGRNGNVETALDLVTTNNYIFSIGATYNGYSNPEGMIVKYDRTSINLITRVGFGSSSSGSYVYFNGIAFDGTYLYVVGQEHSDAAIILVYDENLNIINKYRYSSTVDTQFNKITIDGDYLYITGAIRNNGTYYDGLLVKILKSDLSVVAQKIYGGAGDESFEDLTFDADNIYVVGHTNSEGSGVYDGLALKYNKSDLTLIDKKNIGKSAQDYFYSVINDAGSIYIGGSDAIEGYAIRLDKNFYNINATTTPALLYHQNGLQSDLTGSALTRGASIYGVYTTNTTSTSAVASTSVRSVRKLGPYIIQ